MNKKIGIIIRGSVTDLLPDIIREYNENFPSAEIILSTWEGQKIDNIPCEVVTSKEPEKMPTPVSLSINHQALQAKAGIKKSNAEIILMCRTDQIIHNHKIFDIFEKNCPKEKIMVSTIPGFIKQPPTDYRYSYYICDYCQISTNKLMDELWGDVPNFDGTIRTSCERWLIENYVKNIKKDIAEWGKIKNKYFYELSWYDGFRVEWKKYNESELYRTRLQQQIKKFA